MSIEDLLRQTVEMGSSDLHLKAGRAADRARRRHARGAARAAAHRSRTRRPIADELMPQWRQDAFADRG